MASSTPARRQPEGFEATCSKGPAVQMNRGVPYCLRDFRAGALQGSEICMPQRLQRKASTYVACSATMCQKSGGGCLARA